MTDTVEAHSDFYWSVNARSMSSGDIARSFIAPTQFDVIQRPSHTLIVGPRGSGKTTLLRMLTLDALSARYESDDALGAGIGYIGVFVPTDISWSQQLQSFERLGLDEGVVSQLLETIFSIAVQRAVVDALLQRTMLPAGIANYLSLVTCNFEAASEVGLARALGTSWDLELPLPSLLGVRAALSRRQNELSRWALDATDRRPDSTPSYLGLPMLTVLSSGLDALEAAEPQLLGQRWAILFDELELAPVEIRTKVLAALRSVDARLLFKIALSPYSHDLSLLHNALSSMPGHDHDEVSLSYGRKEAGYDFTLDLMQAVLTARRHQAEDLIAVFGESVFPLDTALSAKFKSLERRSESLARQTRYLRQLFSIDVSFRRYVSKAAGGLDELLSLERGERAQKLRKVLPLVIVRAAFRVPDDSRAKGRRRYSSRKNPDIYGGLVSLAAILEGNPRWIIGLMNALLEASPGTSVSVELQTRELQRTYNRFVALLSTVPVPALRGNRDRGLVSFVRGIGEYFRERVIADDFSPDPVGSFTVDSHASDEVIALVAAALDNGAIVHVPEPEGAAILTSLKGKRFRLSYLIAIDYGLPLRLERELSLAKILEPRQDVGEESLF